MGSLMDKEAARFRVLLAEDDAVSREFLCEAIQACGGQPTACVDGPTALTQARAGNWHLLILDHHLPGMNGEDLCRALRDDPRWTDIPIVLHTSAYVGSNDGTAPWNAVLRKPARMEDFLATVARLTQG